MTTRWRHFLVLPALAMVGTALADGPAFRGEYEYPWPDGSWYPNVGAADQWLDYAPATDIPSQQGDDFGLYYDPDRVGFGQGPNPTRTREFHTRYEFLFGTLVDCDSGLPGECSDLIFASSFES